MNRIKQRFDQGRGRSQAALASPTIIALRATPRHIDRMYNRTVASAYTVVWRREEGSILMQTRSGIVDIPELNVAIFSFFLNFIWEMWQISFFLAVPSGPHWAGVVACTQATFGDAAISLAAYWSVAGFARSRRWILQPSLAQIGSFVMVGVVVTIVFETLATGFLERWNYSPLMPTLPILGTGLVPLLQWILLPPLTIWFVRRQLTRRAMWRSRRPSSFK